MSEILVLTTTDSLDLALRIASALVEQKEAACVNIVPGIRSIYRWEGKVCDDAELLLLIKSSADRFEAIRSRIRQIHTYEVPEVVSLPIAAGDPSYLRWLNEQLKDD
jgi:periplasmic divalent cation tolerance protein